MTVALRRLGRRALDGRGHERQREGEPRAHGHVAQCEREIDLGPVRYAAAARETDDVEGGDSVRDAEATEIAKDVKEGAVLAYDKAHEA